MIVRGLYPYLYHHEGYWVEKYFHPTAVEMMKESYWDEELQAVVSPHDNMLLEALNADEEYTFVGIEMMDEVENEQANHEAADAE